RIDNSFGYFCSFQTLKFTRGLTSAARRPVVYDKVHFFIVQHAGYQKLIASKIPVVGIVISINQNFMCAGINRTKKCFLIEKSHINTSFVRTIIMNNAVVFVE